TWQDRLIDFPSSFGLADPTLVADGRGTFFLAFTIVLSLDGSAVDNYVLRSTDGGATFSAPVSAGKFLDKPALGVDPASGALYMTGTARDARGAGLFLSRSLDGGQTFSGLVRVSSTRAASFN